MLGDTFTLVHNSGTKLLKLVNQDNHSAEYLLREALSMFEARVYHTTVKKTGYRRHGVELKETVFATATDIEFERLSYLVTQSKPSDSNYDLPDSLADWLLVTANANLIAVIGGES